MKNSVFSNFDCDPAIMLKRLQNYGNLRWISPRKTQWSTFFSTKKKNSVRYPKMVVVAILRPNLRTLSGIENFFSQNLTYWYSFWGEFYREWPCRWNHYLTFSWSRSKVEKTIKNSDFSNFDCDTEIMLKWLQDRGNLQWISPQKTLQ